MLMEEERWFHESEIAHVPEIPTKPRGHAKSQEKFQQQQQQQPK